MRIDLSEKLRRLAAVDEELSRAFWDLYLSGSGTERMEAVELLDQILAGRDCVDYARKVFLDPPPPPFCRGSYHLGEVIYPPGVRHGSAGLREQEWIQHLLIVGMSGSGKTNLGFYLLDQLHRHGKPALVFDWKQNYRDLRQIERFRRMPVFTVGQEASPFRFNPLLQPPGAHPGEWLMKLVDVIKHAYFVGEGVEYLLRNAIDEVYEACGIFSGELSQAPNFFQVRAELRSQRAQGRMALWKASATRVLESLCFRHGLGPVVNTSTQFDHRKLLSTHVVLELDSLSDSDKIFFTEAMILWLYELRKHEPDRERFKHALLIEEGHHVLSGAKERHEGVETIMETSLRQIREFGEAVIVIDQEPTKLSNSIKANTFTKIVFNLGNGKDKEDIARCLELSREEASFIELLNIGEAILSMKRPGTTPMHLQIPYFPLTKGKIRDTDL